MMKINRLKIYIEICECVKEQPTYTGINGYDKCINEALKEMEKEKKIK